MAERNTTFRCRTCGEHHRPLPLSYSAKAPLTLLRVPSAERPHRVVITPDQCVIDQALFFLRGRIVVPIRDYAEPFIWGVWAQVSLRDFFRTNQMWNVPGREQEPPFRGRLDTDLALFGSTLDQEVRILTQVVGRRPHVEILAEDHPLRREQRAGITLARAEEIAAVLLHQDQAENIHSGEQAFATH